VKATKADIQGNRLTLRFFESGDLRGNIHIDNVDDLVKFFWQGRSYDAKVKVHVPDELKNLDINSVSGDIDVAGGNLKQLKLQTVSGNIRWTPRRPHSPAGYG
jgi:DUF4097 and DUF4098 domain-containing protein YvlB